MQCQSEDGVPNFRSYSVELIPDDGVIEVTCDRGHHTFIIITEAKYEILSELAVTALHDGYYREAITSFASALERLYEYYIRIACRARGIDHATFTAAWKPLRKASERQLGAFAFLYLLENGGAFPLLGDKYVSLRNNVVHEGIIPDRKEAVTYGQAVGDCAAPLIALLHSARYEEARIFTMFDNIREKSQRALTAGVRYSTQSMLTPFSYNGSTTGFDLEALLAERARRPNMDDAIRELRAHTSQMF